MIILSRQRSRFFNFVLATFMLTSYGCCAKTIDSSPELTDYEKIVDSVFPITEQYDNRMNVRIVYRSVPSFLWEYYLELELDLTESEKSNYSMECTFPQVASIRYQEGRLTEKFPEAGWKDKQERILLHTCRIEGKVNDQTIAVVGNLTNVKLRFRDNNTQSIISDPNLSILLIQNKFSLLTLKTSDVILHNEFKKWLKVLLDRCPCYDRRKQLLFFEESTNTQSQVLSKEEAQISAAQNGDYEKVQKLFHQGAKINYQSANGLSALMAGVHEGDCTICNFLIEKGANCNLQDDFGETALMKAFQEDSSEITRILLDHGADINPKDKDGWTALHYAARYGSSEIISEYPQFFQIVNQKDNFGYTPLMLAAWNGHLNTVKVLLQNGAKPEEKVRKGEYTGFDALKFATTINNIEIERTLISYIQNH
jgi:ankyrin repeat protein